MIDPRELPEALQCDCDECAPRDRKGCAILALLLVGFWAAVAAGVWAAGDKLGWWA